MKLYTNTPTFSLHELPTWTERAKTVMTEAMQPMSSLFPLENCLQAKLQTLFKDLCFVVM